MVKKLGSRHRSRKRAVDLLFEAEAKNILPSELVEPRRELAASDSSVGAINDYTALLVNGVSDDYQQLDAVITSYLKDWTLDRLPAVDRAILRVATWELFHATDVPPVVAVDEAVELARELSTDESPTFINGVLGNIVKLAPIVRESANGAGPVEGDSQT